MTGDGHPSTIPAMNTGNDAIYGNARRQINGKHSLGGEGGWVEKLTGQGVMACFTVGQVD